MTCGSGNPWLYRITTFAAIFTFQAKLLHANSAQREELSLERIVFSATELKPEISGVLLHKNKLMVLSDQGDDDKIYAVEVDKKKNSFRLKPFIEFKKLLDATGYLKKIMRAASGPEKDLDLEGIAHCGEDFYLVNERRREVVKVDKKSIQLLNIDFSSAEGVYEGDANAGFEGIAVDCQANIMYVAKEREPTFIVEVDMQTLKAKSVLQLEGSDRLGQKVIHPKTGEGLMAIEKDISDLFFVDGFLYVLERNQWSIQKFDPRTKKMVARVSYLFSEKDLYTTGMPFGLAEALLITPTQIILGMDQGSAPLSVLSKEKYKHQGRRGSLLFFKRPEGF